MAWLRTQQIAFFRMDKHVTWERASGTSVIDTKYAMTLILVTARGQGENKPIYGDIVGYIGCGRGDSALRRPFEHPENARLKLNLDFHYRGDWK